MEYFYILLYSFVVWYDVLDDSEVVPVFEGEIICKVTRLPAKAAQIIYKSDSNSENQDQFEETSNVNQAKEFDQFINVDGQSTATRVVNENVSQSTKEEDLLNGFVCFFLLFLISSLLNHKVCFSHAFLIV